MVSYPLSTGTNTIRELEYVPRNVFSGSGEYGCDFEREDLVRKVRAGIPGLRGTLRFSPVQIRRFDSFQTVLADVRSRKVYHAVILFYFYIRPYPYRFEIYITM